MQEIFVARTFGPLTEERAITLIVAVLAAGVASFARVGLERAAQRRQGLPLTPVLDMLPDLVMGSLAGLCLALLVNWVRAIDAETTWLFAMLGGAGGPPLMSSLLRAAAGRAQVDLPPPPAPPTSGGTPHDDPAPK